MSRGGLCVRAELSHEELSGLRLAVVTSLMAGCDLKNKIKIFPDESKFRALVWKLKL